MNKRICAFALALALVFSLFLSIKPKKAFSLSKEEIINNAELSPLKTGYAELDALVIEIFGRRFTEGMTVYDKLKACYDEVIYDTTYGASYNSRMVAVLQREQGYIAEHDAYIALRAYTFLTGRVGVCNDYSCAFVVLSRALGFDSHIVTGKTNKASGGYAGHMWVTIRIGGEYYAFDPQVECNIAARQPDGKIIYSRFVATDEEMKKKLIYDDREGDVAKFNGFQKYDWYLETTTADETETTSSSFDSTTDLTETTTVNETPSETDVVTIIAYNQSKVRAGNDLRFKIKVDNPSGNGVSVVMGIKEETTVPSDADTSETSDETLTTSAQTGETGPEETEETIISETEETSPDTEPSESETITSEATVTEPGETECSTTAPTEETVTEPCETSADLTDETDTTAGNEPENTEETECIDVTDNEPSVTEPSETTDVPSETEPGTTAAEEQQDVILQTEDGEITVLKDARTENGTLQWKIDRTGTYSVYLFLVTETGYEKIAGYVYEFRPEYSIVYDGDYVSGFAAGMPVSCVELAEGEAVLDKNKNDISASDIITTGCFFVSGEKEYAIYVKGDTDGDGKITVTDYVLIKKAILGTLGFEDVYFKAADSDGDGVLSSTDYILVKMHMLDLLDMYI